MQTVLWACFFFGIALAKQSQRGDEVSQITIIDFPDGVNMTSLRWEECFTPIDRPIMFVDTLTGPSTARPGERIRFVARMGYFQTPPNVISIPYTIEDFWTNNGVEERFDVFNGDFCRVASCPLRGPGIELGVPVPLPANNPVGQNRLRFLSRTSGANPRNFVCFNVWYNVV
jgi:hypothetical protein